MNTNLDDLNLKIAVEICSTTLGTTIVADRLGVQRIELCSAITQGGLTPSYGLIEACVQQTDIDIFVMIRHRQGNFVYAEEDISIMINDIFAVKQAQAHGVVFGCLTKDNEVDVEQSKRLINIAKQHQLGTTFHRAFDFCNDPLIALEQIIELGFDRILTSGQKTAAIEGAQLIEELVQQANGRIEIMAGSGVNATNAQELTKTGVDALHFTAHKVNTDPLRLGMGSRMTVDEDKIRTVVESLVV